MEGYQPQETLPLGLATTAAHFLALYHRANIEGLGYLPRGPALLVGNHGRFGLDTFVFLYLLWRYAGRRPFGLADRRFFGFPPLQLLLRQMGGVIGTKENALALLRAGALVVVYPGGAREVFKGRGARQKLAWQRSIGFARVAIRAQVKVVPFCGLGVDDTYLALGYPPLSRRVLGKYAIPAVIGLGPFPLPARLRFRVGAPLTPPRSLSSAESFKRRVQGEVEALLGGG
ncbi:MAG: 1-acyl-sn-glycerol-3-phosphate acyltransferase [Myxococcaceae bacterium]